MSLGIEKMIRKPLEDIYGSIKDEVKATTHEKELIEIVDELEKEFLDVVKVKTIYQGDKSIDLNTFYVPTKVNIDGNIEKVNLIEKIPSNFIVFEGTVGQGKSIFMRYLTYNEAKNKKSKPVFFEFKNLGNNTIENSIKKKLKNWIDIFKEDDFDYLIDSNKFSLFLDGFDEIPSDKVSQVIFELENWCQKYPNLKIIISSRPDSGIQNSTYFDVYKLMQYGIDEQFQLINKLVKDDNAKEELKKSIRESNLEIKELLKTPLMVTLYVMKYRANFETPNTQSDFYNDLFHVLSYTHDKTKPGYKREFKSKLDENRLQIIFEEFCFKAGNMRKLTFTAQETLTLTKKIISKYDFPTTPINVLEDFSGVICLLLRDGNNYTFIHRSIQEFYYASYVSKKEDEGKIDFYTRLDDEDFLEGKINVLNFLEDIDTYHYYKLFALPNVNKFIDLFEISKDKNSILDKTYISKGNHANEDDNTLYFNMYLDNRINIETYLIIKKDFDMSIFLLKNLNISRTSVSSKKVSLEELKEPIILRSYLINQSKTEFFSQINSLTNKFIDYKAHMEKIIKQRNKIDFDNDF